MGFGEEDNMFPYIQEFNPDKLTGQEPPFKTWKELSSRHEPFIFSEGQRREMDNQPGFTVTPRPDFQFAN